MRKDNIVYFKNSKLNSNERENEEQQSFQRNDINLDKKEAIERVFVAISELCEAHKDELTSINITDKEWMILFDVIYEELVANQCECNFYLILLMIIQCAIPMALYSGEITLNKILVNLDMPLQLCHLSPEMCVSIKRKVFLRNQKNNVVDLEHYREVNQTRFIRGH